MTEVARMIRLIMRLREGGVSDTRVLSAIEKVPRELFVPEAFRDQAYEDRALPIAGGQTISQPVVVGLMTQALDVGERMTVLEIGTGSGYQTAVLAGLCRRVYTIERDRALARDSEALLARLKIYNVTPRAGDGARGWPEQAPFDRILVTAAAEDVPTVLVDQLTPDGVMVVPVGGVGRRQTVLRLRRREDGYVSDELFPVRFVPLVSGTKRTA